MYTNHILILKFAVDRLSRANQPTYAFGNLRWGAIVGRRTGLGGVVAAIAREAARQQRFAEAERRRRSREAERIERTRQRTLLQNQRAEMAQSQREQERFEKSQYLANREAEPPT
jgi:hypothetical protein